MRGESVRERQRETPRRDSWKQRQRQTEMERKSDGKERDSLSLFFRAAMSDLEAGGVCGKIVVEM
jgi:hypothetical protein